LLDRTARAAWQTGDPGVIFLDAINRDNPISAAGRIETTNPCGEVPLLPYEACNLGSINLSHMVHRRGIEYAIDWEKLRYTTQLAIRFLDDVIEVGRWPAPQISSIVLANRKVGLGVMGFAELLILLGIPYTGHRAVALAEELMQFVAEEALLTSEQLAEERGVFRNWEYSIYAR
jgi:ribonucleoside-diphosphate reductase alpha chain